MTKEEIIKKYDQKRMGGAQNSASSKSALSKEEIIKKYDERQAAKTRERQMIEIANRTPEEVMKSTYQSYIPEEYKGTFENVNLKNFEEIEILKNTMGADVLNYKDIAEHMTEDELKFLKKIYEENGLDILSGDSKHNAYIKGLREEIDRRRIETAAYNARKNDGFWGKVGTSVKSVGNNLMSVATMEGVGNAINGLLGHEIDETPYYQTMTEVQRQAVSEDMSGFGKFLYNTGMSMADSAVMTAIGALIGGGAGAAATKVAEAVTLIGMGSQAMSSTITDSKKRGMSDGQAVANGVVAGILEAVFEKIGLDALFDTKLFKNSVASYLFKNIGSNAAEEAGTEIAQIVSDGLIGWDKSNFAAKVREYESGGYSESGAAAMAVLSSLGDTGLAALSGALMGLGFGGAGIARNTIKTNAADVQRGRQITELAHANTDLYGAAKLAEDAEINKILDAVYKAKEGSRAKYRLTGKLARQTGKAYDNVQEQGFTPEEIERFGESYEPTPFEREYETYKRKVGKAAAVDLEEEAKALAAKNAGEDYGDKYEGETRDAYYKGLAKYENKGKAYQYPLWFEIARKMGQDSNGRSVDEMIKTLPFSDRRGVLSLDTDTIKAAFNDGKRIADAIAEEQKAADERRKRGEERIEARKRAVEAEKGKESIEGEKTASETTENTSNVTISDDVKHSELSLMQKKAIAKIKQVMKYIPGYEVTVQKGHEYDGKLNDENGYFDPIKRMIYLNIDAGKVTGKIKIRGQDVAVELYDVALESALTHEIGHAIRMDSPKLYAELRDFIRTKLYREGGFQNLVKQRQQQYADVLGREISYEYAEEEVICNSLGDILTSERVMDELAGTHRNLFARIWRLVKDFFSKILKRMRSMDGDFAYKTTEQRVVEKALLVERRRLEDLFVKALRDASATSKATLAIGKSEAQKNVAESSENRVKSSENAENTQKTATQPQKNSGSDNGTDASKTAETAEKKTLADTESETVQVSEGKWALSNADVFEIKKKMSDQELSECNEVAKFIDEVNAMIDTSKRTKRKKKIGIITQSHALIINKLLQTLKPNFSAVGYELWIDGTAAEHIEDRHGKNGEADKTMASSEVKSLIPWAVQNADSGEIIKDSDGAVRYSDRFYDSNGERAPQIRLEKETEESIIYVSECVPDSHNKRIWITSAYTNKKSSKGQLLNIEDKSSPQPTSKTFFDSDATNTSISDSAEKVNPSGEKSLKDVLTKKYSLRDTLAREQLSEMFYEMAATPVEREIVEKYKAEIVNIDAKIDERREILERLSEIEGKSGFGGERERLEGRLKGVNAYITGRDRRLFELESAKPFKEMVERYDAELAKKREAAPKALSNSRYAYVSRGRYNELIAKEKGEKFYTQKDAQVVEKRIAGFDKLSRRKKNIIVDELWQGMNAAKTEAEREGVIRSVRDMIFAEIERSAKIENPEYADIEQTLLYLSGYVQRLSFTDEMKGEIRHKLDESGTKSFMGRWQNKKSDGKAVPAETFVTDFAREVDGYAYLEDMNAADALFEIDELYGRLKNVDETVDAFYDASSAELQAILDNIEESVREAFQEGGHEVTPGNGTLTAQAIKQREEAKARAKEKVDEVMSYHKATLAADREARSIRDLKRGTFDNATEIKGDRVMELLRELGKFEYRGTFSVNNFREKVRGLNEWYHSDNAKNLLNKTKTEDGEYSEFIANTLQQISSGKGRVTADELWAFSKVLAHFRRIAEGYNKVWRAGKWEDALPIAQRYVGTLKLSRDLKGANTFFQKVYRMYFNEFADPLSVVRRYDGYIEDGYFTDMFLMFRDAEVELETTHSDVMKDYHTFLDKKENKHYLRDLQERYVEVYGERIPMEQALSLYMMLRQDHALMGFVDGGVQYKGFDGDMHMARSLASKANIELKIQLMAKEVAKDYGISMKEAEAKARETVTSDTFKTEDMTIDELRAAVKPTMDAIKEKMTDADRELLSIIEKSMNGTLRELKRATDLERLGFSNVMEGFYFPIKRAGTAEKVETLAYNDELQSVSNISANKSREQGARQPLRIDSIIKTYERHAKAIVTYATMQQAVDFYDRIYNVSVTGNPNDAEKVATAANEVWGPRKAETRGNHAFFKELIADIQGLKTGKESIFNDMVGLLRGGMATAGIGLNGKVLLSQWSSYAAALPEMSFGSLMKAAAKRFGIGAKGIFSKEGREALIEYGKIVDEYCQLARVRHEENYAYLAQGVIEKGDGTVKVKGKVTEGLNEFREATMKPIGWMDRAVVCTLFEACKYETATADAPLDSEENLKAAGKKLEEVILNTQQNALATEKSRAMRSDQELMKGLVMFSSDSMRSLSRFLDYAGELHSINRQLKTFQMSDAAKETLQSRKKEVGRKLRNSIIAISANAIWMAALTLFFRFMRGKKIEREDILEDLALDIFTGYFGGMPLLRDLVDQVTKGYGVTDSALDSIGDFVGAFTSVFTTISKVIQGEREWGALVGQLRKFAFAIAQVTGIPVRNVWNCIYGWINIFSKDTADAIEGFLAG